MKNLKNLKAHIANHAAAAIGFSTRNITNEKILEILISKVFDPYLGWRDLELSSKTAFGSNLKLTLPDSIQTCIFLTGTWEPTITKFVTSTLKHGDIFIDIGANIEYYTLLASKLVGNSGFVYSFEASPAIFKRLEENVILNKITNAKIYNAAVSNRVGVTTIWTAPKGNLGHSTIIQRVAENDGHSRETEIPCNTITAIMPRLEMLRARLIKIDIEGAERLAIEGIFPELSKFSTQTEWLVELSPCFSPGGTKDIDWIFETFRSADYFAYQIENIYAPLHSQRKSHKRELTKIQKPPSVPLSDIIFSKEKFRDQ